MISTTATARRLTAAVLATTLATTIAGTTAATALAATAPTSLTPAMADQPGSAGRGTAAGTIVFIKNHNVWIARGDGTGARALTRDGDAAFPYGSPTQSDNGVVVATHVYDLVRMNQSGRVLNEINPGPLPTSAGKSIDGIPAHAAISPDGKRIAYTFTQYVSPLGFRSATGYTAADRLTSTTPQRSTYFWAPSWVGNNRTLQTGGNGSHVMVQDLGSEPTHWFDDRDIYAPSTDLGNAELSRDGRYLAAVRGYGDDTSVIWYAVNGNAKDGPPPADPTPLCKLDAVPRITNPTWGPDSDSLAWQEPDGIWTRSSARDCSVESTLVLPNGIEPHWSSAPLSAVELTNLSRPVISGPARYGRVLKASTGRWSRTALSYAFAWYRNGGRIAGAAATKQSYRVARADRGAKLTVRVTARSGGTMSSAVSRAVRVARS